MITFSNNKAIYSYTRLELEQHLAQIRSIEKLFVDVLSIRKSDVPKYGFYAGRYMVLFDTNIEAYAAAVKYYNDPDAAWRVETVYSYQTANGTNINLLY